MNDPARSIAAAYERYHQSLFRFCYSIVGNAEDAQDALQNAMLKAVRALPGEQREIQLKPWLYRIAHNESIEILRKRRDEAQIDPELVASTAGPDESAATRERLRRLLADLGDLPERQRGALVMRELAGLGFGEIATALGTSEAVARQTVYEARLGLQQLEAGREMSCDSVMRQISDADGRTMRRRDIRAHLRSCRDCRQFREAIDGRSRDLAAIAPLPAAASVGILHAVLGGAGQAAGAGAGASAGAGAAGTIGAGAGKAVATSAVLKSVATVAVVATLGVGAADRGGVVDVGLSADDGGSVSRSETSGGSGGTARSEAAPSEEAVVAAGVAGAGQRGVAGVARAKGREAVAGAGATGTTGPTGAQPPAEHGRGSQSELPAASQHGQETAASHKATPQAGPGNSSSHHGRGHEVAAAHRSHHGGHGHSRSHGASHSHHGSRSHGAKAHSHGSPTHPRGSSGVGSQAGRQPKPQPNPPPRVESEEAQAPATTAPDARTGVENTETSP